MKIIPLFGSGTFHKSAVVTRQKRVNCYYENRPDGDKAKIVLYGTPGMVPSFTIQLPGSEWITIQNITLAGFAPDYYQFTVTGPNNFTVGQTVVISNVMYTGFNVNGTWNVYSATTGSFTFLAHSLGFVHFTYISGGIFLDYTAGSALYSGAIATAMQGTPLALYMVFQVPVSQQIFIAITPIATAAYALSTDIGNTSIAYSPSQVLIVDSAYGYVYTPSTGAFISVNNWPAIGAQTCTYVAGFFVAEQPGTQNFWVSNFQDATTWNSLSFAAAASGPDNIMAVDNLLGNLLIFRYRGCEFWQNLGSAPEPFAPILSAANEYGLAAIFSRQHIDQSMIYLAQNAEGGIQFVEIIDSYVPQVISDADIDDIINDFETFDDAVALTYMRGSHKFYQCTFPSENLSFLFDCSTRQWSYAQTGTGTTGRHLANLSALYGTTTYFTDSVSSQIYTMDDNTFTDNGTSIVREIITRHVLSNFNRIRPSLLYLDMETGVGLQSGQGSNPTVMVEYSKDDGRTWSGPRTMSLGAVGAYQTRMVLRRFGSSRTATWRIRMSDPVKFVVTEAAMKIAEKQPAERLG